VISTLRDLLDTGDELVAVDGILSGTLAWLFNKFDGSTPFSDLVREAHALGYTEPDPRDDLSGMDVARKLVILGREAGMALSLEDVRVQGLVPEALRDTDRDSFMAGLASLDAPMQAALEAARARGCVLRYVARLQRDGNASVALQELPADHAFAHLRLTDNCVQFTTRRYRDNPLVVQGPWRRSRGHRRRRVLRPVAPGRRTGSAPVSGRMWHARSRRAPSATSASASTSSATASPASATSPRCAASMSRSCASRRSAAQSPTCRWRPNATPPGRRWSRLREALALPFGFEIELDKGIPLGSGLGGSAASCVAALVAANALLDAPLDAHALYPHAMAGEAVASGGRHGDNVGPMLLGGLVLATADRLTKIAVPAAVACGGGASACGAGDPKHARAALAGSYALSRNSWRRARNWRRCCWVATAATPRWCAPDWTMCWSSRAARR
jgi:hypothetical protein